MDIGPRHLELSAMASETFGVLVLAVVRVPKVVLGRNTVCRNHDFQQTLKSLLKVEVEVSGHPRLMRESRKAAPQLIGDNGSCIH